MAKFNYTDEMKGIKPFRCYVCNKVLLVSIEGEYEVKLNCPRCKTRIVLICRYPVPAELAVKNGELVKL